MNLIRDSLEEQREELREARPGVRAEGRRLIWLTPVLNLIDVTLACEDAYSKLVEVVTVADVSDVDRAGNSL